MSKKPSSRFDDLFSAARNKTQETSSESTTTKDTKKSKSRDPDYVRTTIYLPKRLHQKLKIAAVQGDKDMSEIIEGLVDTWVQQEDV